MYRIFKSRRYKSELKAHKVCKAYFQTATNCLYVRAISIADPYHYWVWSPSRPACLLAVGMGSWPRCKQGLGPLRAPPQGSSDWFYCPITLHYPDAHSGNLMVWAEHRIALCCSSDAKEIRFDERNWWLFSKIQLAGYFGVDIHTFMRHLSLE